MSTYNRNRDIKLQELASRLVEREVFCCVSSLVDTLSKLTQAAGYDACNEADMSWEDDIQPLLEGYDYESAAEAAIDDADLDDLETYADAAGYWSDVLESIGYETYCDTQRELGQEPVGLEEWLDAQDALGDDAPTMRQVIRNEVKALVTNHEEFCREQSVNLDDWREDIYEHWVVTDWLARKLKDMGYVTGDLCGLTIYGRGCTGQSMALDNNMQTIAAELWPEELERL